METEESFSYVMYEPIQENDNWKCEIMFNRREWTNPPRDYDFIVGTGIGSDEAFAFREAYHDMLMYFNRIHAIAQDFWPVFYHEMFSRMEAD